MTSRKPDCWRARSTVTARRSRACGRPARQVQRSIVGIPGVLVDGLVNGVVVGLVDVSME
nr:hypothetical protein [Streptosporangium nondiastaticum]